MRRIVLASHGTLAAGMKSSLEIIAGPQPQVSALCAYTEGSPDLKEALAGLVSGLAEGDELVLVTDLLGGSVNNEASQLCEIPGVTVVTGMNLGLVLSLALGDAPDTAALVDGCLEGARSQLVRMAPSADEDDEDF